MDFPVGFPPDHLEMVIEIQLDSSHSQLDIIIWVIQINVLLIVARLPNSHI